MYDNVTFECILDANSYPIQIQTPEGSMRLSQYGCMSLSRYAKCVIFPKGKTTWEGFVPPCKFKDGDIMYVKTINRHEYIIIFKEIKNDYIHKYVCFTYQRLSIDKCPVCQLADAVIMRPATEEEKQKLFKAIKENGYKWNPETKTPEKLIESKFKVGDRIKDKNNKKWFVVQVSDKHFDISLIPNAEGYFVPIEDQDDYELVPNDFDFSKLVPFESKVLVRNDNEQRWIPAFWGGKREDGYVTTFGWSKYCIPYEGNEHLLRTSE